MSLETENFGGEFTFYHLKDVTSADTVCDWHYITLNKITLC